MMQSMKLFFEDSLHFREDVSSTTEAPTHLMAIIIIPLAAFRSAWRGGNVMRECLIRLQGNKNLIVASSPGCGADESDVPKKKSERGQDSGSGVLICCRWPTIWQMRWRKDRESHPCRSNLSIIGRICSPCTSVICAVLCALGRNLCTMIANCNYGAISRALNGPSGQKHHRAHI
ncbi:hypothetical protein DMENIID0001_143890 [Sergentomyia squamirostris]